MILDDWCICPNSKYPAILSAYKKYIQKEIETNGEAVDPVLGKPIEAGSLSLLSPDEATKYIQRYNGVVEKKATEETKEEESKTDDKSLPTESRAAKGRAASSKQRR